MTVNWRWCFCFVLRTCLPGTVQQHMQCQSVQRWRFFPDKWPSSWFSWVVRRLFLKQKLQPEIYMDAICQFSVNLKGKLLLAINPMMLHRNVMIWYECTGCVMDLVWCVCTNCQCDVVNWFISVARKPAQQQDVRNHDRSLLVQMTILAIKWRLALCSKSPGASLNLSNTINIMNVHLDFSLSVWPKGPFESL